MPFILRVPLDPAEAGPQQRLLCTGPVRVCGLVGSWMLAQLVTDVGADEAETFFNYHT